MMYVFLGFNMKKTLLLLLMPLLAWAEPQTKDFHGAWQCEEEMQNGEKESYRLTFEPQGWLEQRGQTNGLEVITRHRPYWYSQGELHSRARKMEVKLIDPLTYLNWIFRNDLDNLHRLHALLADGIEQNAEQIAKALLRAKNEQQEKYQREMRRFYGQKYAIKITEFTGDSFKFTNSLIRGGSCKRIP